MKTAIVILNYNGAHFLRQFLPAVLLHSALPDTEIIVADNASTDNSVEILKLEFPQIRIISLAENYGFAGGYNRALQQVEAEYYVLLNSDVEVSVAWLDPLVDYMDINAEVAACQPKIRSFKQRNMFEYAGAAGGFIDCYGFPFCRGRIFGTLEEDKGQYDSPTEIFWATGACLLVRSNDFWAAGALDDDFFAHMEEIDLCWRLHNRGKTVVCLPQSIVYHVGGGTLSAENPHKTYLNFRNNLLMLYKNLPEKYLNKILFIRRLADGLATLQFLLTGKVAYIRSIWKAHQDFDVMKKTFSAKRKHELSVSRNENIKSIYPKSIIIQYYLRGKKKFSDYVF